MTMNLAPSAAVQLPTSGDLYLTDAGLETELVFKDGIDLPHFSSAPLVERPDGRARLREYYRSFATLAARHGLGLVLEAATWRISRDWSELLNVDREGRRRINREAVKLLAEVRGEGIVAHERFVVSGNIGPRSDGYVVGRRMSIDEAEDYHREQIGDLAAAGADVITAMTLTTPEEGAGVARAAREAGLPAVICFTVETNGDLPSGERLGDAIAMVDEAVAGAVAYFGINCAHPTHFREVLRDLPSWRTRIGALRANASSKSHAELDACTTLDDGDPDELAAQYAELLELLPNVRVVGGCCGTDIRHVDRIGEVCAAHTRTGC